MDQSHCRYQPPRGHMDLGTCEHRHKPDDLDADETIRRSLSQSHDDYLRKVAPHKVPALRGTVSTPGGLDCTARETRSKDATCGSSSER